MQKNPEIIAIAALGERTRNICQGDQLLWTIPDDLKRVKSLTLNHPIIMGRKTYESIGRPLPGRTNIIITRNKDYQADEQCVVVNDLDAAFEAARKVEGGEQIFIFGGAEIYTLALDKTDRLMLTLVDSDKPGSAKFPEYEDKFVVEKRYEPGGYNDLSYQWVDYVRK